jgi:hypothetical protein
MAKRKCARHVRAMVFDVMKRCAHFSPRQAHRLAEDLVELCDFAAVDQPVREKSDFGLTANRPECLP